MSNRRFWSIAAALILLMVCGSWFMGHASAKGTVMTIDAGYYNATEMKQPKNINGENQWNNGTYSDTKINKNNVVFDIRDKLTVGADLTITPTSGTWVYYPANISGNLISYTNARGRIAYEDLDTILKETIILNAPVSSIQWTLNLSMKPQSLGFQVDADGYSINDPANTDQRIKIPFPYVTDTNGVKRTLSYSWNNGQRRLTLNRDFSGLTYPLTIDPSYVVDTTGAVGYSPRTLVNTTNIPQIIYQDNTNDKLKLATNISGVLSSVILPSISTGFGLIGVSLNHLNDLPLITHPGTLATQQNFSWYSGIWRNTSIRIDPPTSSVRLGTWPIGQSTDTNRVFLTWLNSTNGHLNLTVINDISGSSIVFTGYTLFKSSTPTLIIGGTINASNIMNILFADMADNTAVNLTTVTDASPPTFSSSLIAPSTSMNTSTTARIFDVDINPSNDFPGYIYVPRLNISGIDDGRSINYSYFNEATQRWRYETAYTNKTKGYSRMIFGGIGYNLSGTAYVAFIEQLTTTDADDFNKHIFLIKRTGTNTWSDPVDLRGGADLYNPSLDFDQQDGLHIAWFNDTTDDLEYYFEPLPVSAGAAPVAAFACTPIAGVRNASRTCTDASTNTPTSWAWWSPSTGNGCVLNGSLPANQNPVIAPLNYSYCSICLTATNAFGSGSTCKANYLYISQPQTVI